MKKNVAAFVLLLLVIPILFLSAWLGSVIVGCIVSAFIIIYNCYAMMMNEPYEPPHCETCGQLIEEGADMALEDEFEVAPHQPASGKKEGDHE